jgi:hypothetical protein
MMLLIAETYERVIAFEKSIEAAKKVTRCCLISRQTISASDPYRDTGGRERLAGRPDGNGQRGKNG